MNPWIVLPAIVVVGVVYVMLPIGLNAFVRYRRRKLLLCPVARDPARIQVNARRAGVSAAFGHPSLRVMSCSLWPERNGCGRECVRLSEAEMHDLREPAAA